MRVSGCQYLLSPGPPGHSPAPGPGAMLTRGPGAGPSPGITDEIEVFRLGAGVVGRPGSTRGDSLPTLKQDKLSLRLCRDPGKWRIIVSRKTRSWYWTGTGAGCAAAAAVVRLICQIIRAAEQLSE